jgi:hypothetical protein
MKPLDEETIMEGMTYTQKEIDEISAELLKPASAPAETPKIDIKVGKGLQFITDSNLYKEIIKYFTQTFPDHSDVLNEKFNWDDSQSVATGSSPYIDVAVDMFLRKQNSKCRIATQRDLETNLQMFKNCYEDTGLALRSVADPNKNQAENLYNQIKKASSNIGYPIFIELRNLELGPNLNFKITPQSRYKKAECLNWENGTHYSQVEDYGLPKAKDASSTRQIWTAKGGLVGACLVRNVYFLTSNDDLSYSNDSGRVVLVSAEGGAP